MVFDTSELIASLSEGADLHAGTVVLAGTHMASGWPRSRHAGCGGTG